MNIHLAGLALHHEHYPVVDRYPFNLAVLRHTRHLPLNAAVTFFVGENGSGKSTLLEAIARACGIHIWRERPRLRYRNNLFEQQLHRFLSVEWTDGPVPGSFFGSAVFQDFVDVLDEWALADPDLLAYFGGSSLRTQSHGQSLMAFFRTRYRIKGLYLLDEPETALSPKTQLELLELLVREGAAGHAQFIVATHSPILLSCPGAVIYSFDHVPVSQVAFEETEHFQVYERFFRERS